MDVILISPLTGDKFVDAYSKDFWLQDKVYLIILICLHFFVPAKTTWIRVIQNWCSHTVTDTSRCMFPLDSVQQPLAVMSIILHSCPQKSSNFFKILKSPEIMVAKSREKNMSWKFLKSPEILTIFLVRAIINLLIETRFPCIFGHR